MADQKPDKSKKGLFSKIGRVIKSAGVAVLETAANILMAGRGGDD